MHLILIYCSAFLLLCQCSYGKWWFYLGEKGAFEIQKQTKKHLQYYMHKQGCCLICSKPASSFTHLKWHGLHCDFLSLGKSLLSSLKKKQNKKL